MANEEVSVTAQDLNELGEKLDKADLSDKDKKIVLAAFAAAGEAVSAKEGSEVSGFAMNFAPMLEASRFNSPSLRSHLVSGFQQSLSSGLRRDLSNKAIIISVGF
jgi:hypothetical protein